MVLNESLHVLQFGNMCILGSNAVHGMAFDIGENSKEMISEKMTVKPLISVPFITSLLVVYNSEN